MRHFLTAETMLAMWRSLATAKVSADSIEVAAPHL